MTDTRGVLFVPYQDTLALLSVEDALRICEDVYGMHARGSVVWSSPASFKLDVADGFNNHWHVKSVLLKDIPTTGVRLYWMGPRRPKILGLVGIGTMGTNALQCLCSMYKFEEIRCTSRRPETRAAFARKWSQALGIAVVPKDSIEEVVRGADIAVGGTTSGDVVSREPWLKPGCTFISLARRELDPAGWSKLDKVVIDSWDFNMLQREFRRMVESGQFSRAQLYGEIHELVSGGKKGRERDDERILIHTTGLVSQDVALAHFLYRTALDKGLGTWLPRAGGAACGAGAGGRSTT